jgi:protein-arginine kinase activator protein McsA
MPASPVISKTGEWVILRKHIDKQIEKLRSDLEDNHDYAGTARIRGEIASLKWLIRQVDTDLPDPHKQADYN